MIEDDANILAAIRHGADAGGASIASRLDQARAGMWRLISRDQSRLARERLDAFLGARCER